MAQDRNQDLQTRIKEAYQLLSLLESRYLTASDPKERMRLKNDIDETKAQIASYQAEYSQTAQPQPTPAPLHSQPTQTNKIILSPQERAKVRQYLIARFSLAELQTIAFDLNVDDKLPNNGILSDYAQQLIAHCQRVEQLHDLLQLALSLRPDSEIAQLLQKPA